jgi:hypothetical protein
MKTFIANVRAWLLDLAKKCVPPEPPVRRLPTRSVKRLKPLKGKK